MSEKVYANNKRAVIKAKHSTLCHTHFIDPKIRHSLVLLVNRRAGKK